MSREILDLSTFYSIIDNKIKIISSYLQDDDFYFILKSCRLKPYELFYSYNEGKKIKYSKKWFDEFGSTLNIKNKKVKIKYNDFDIDSSKINITDFYYGLDLDNIIKISKLCYYSKSIDCFGNINYVVCFLGIDGYLRAFMLYLDEITKISPLYLGLDILKEISRYKDAEDFYTLVYNKEIITPFNITNSYIFSLPIHNTLFDTIYSTDEHIANFFKGARNINGKN